MSPHLDELKRLLRELFQIDQADLDFGIYRIMGQRREEVNRFLDERLPAIVQEGFAKYDGEGRKQLQKELDEAVASAKTLGADPDTLPKVKELRAKLAATADAAKLEADVYSHLYTFFSRYWDEGDFISRRRYSSKDKYAIPYNGEEVKLYWANHDQYYIKSSEDFSNYAFRTASGRRVRFEIVQASTETDNNKAQGNRERRFELAEDAPVEEADGELTVRFQYALKEGKKNRAEQARELAQEVLDNPKAKAWKADLSAPAPDSGKDREKSLIESCIGKFTARNTFDYFIHKDLEGFLRRELDFYVKNEVMHLDDVEEAAAPKVEEYLSKIKVIRAIAHGIIRFLAQIENFQKKLWLKKKFVVETNWCITLDRISEEFWDEIAKNKAQVDEWVSLHAVGDIKKDLSRQGFSRPPTRAFLKEHPALMVDTRYFSAEFSERLLAGLDGDLDEETAGLLLHGENFQALSLLREKYDERVQCVYIDPPYNTDASSIDYKNGYKNSSWISLVYDRISVSYNMISKSGVLISAIDDTQFRELSISMERIFNGVLLGTICVRSNPSGRPTQTGYSVSHEYLIFAGKSHHSRISRLPPTEEQQARFSQVDDIGPFEWRNLRREGSNSDRAARPGLYYPIYISGQSIRVPKMEWDAERSVWIVREKPKSNESVVYPNNDDGDEKTWRWEAQTVISSLELLSVRPDRGGRDYIYYKRRPHDDGVVTVSTWFDAKYSATEHGTSLLKRLFDKSPFSYPKSIYAVRDAIFIGGASAVDSTILDYFAGSGTTAHAVTELNRQDGGRRKVILVEAGKHFDTVLLPRLKKITYSPEWKDGKPERLATKEEVERGPHLIKYLRLESYEDALNNLELPAKSALQGDLLKGSGDTVRDDYLLSYLLDLETKDSLLRIRDFRDPFSYRLKLVRSDETRTVTADLVETFNYLIGLKVRAMGARERFKANFKKDEQGRLVLSGKLTKDDGGPWVFRVIEGTDPGGRNVLVVWRTLTGDPVKDNAVLDEFFRTRRYRTKDTEWHTIYVNGDSNLENLKRGDETWKVRLIEKDFHDLMFNVQDV